MNTYIVAFNYTDQGIRTIREASKRFEALKQSVRDIGGELKAFYSIMGQFDSMALIAAPNDEAIARFALSVASMGNVRTTTMRAFTEAEFLKITSSLL